MSRVVDPGLADSCMARAEALADEVEAVLSLEKEERALGQAERDVRRGENLVGFEAEIKSRPRRTWFATGREKELAREKGRLELNGYGDGDGPPTHKKQKPPSSNKQRKSADAKREMRDGRQWKKGRDRIRRKP